MLFIEKIAFDSHALMHDHGEHLENEEFIKNVRESVAIMQGNVQGKSLGQLSGMDGIGPAGLGQRGSSRIIQDPNDKDERLVKGMLNTKVMLATRMSQIS